MSRGGGGGCYLHVVPLVTSFRRLNTPSTCLPWVASHIGGRRNPEGVGACGLHTPNTLRRLVWWTRLDQSAGLVDLVSIFVYYRLISFSIIQDIVIGSATCIFIYTIVDTRVSHQHKTWSTMSLHY